MLPNFFPDRKTRGETCLLIEIDGQLDKRVPRLQWLQVNRIGFGSDVADEREFIIPYFQRKFGASRRLFSVSTEGNYESRSSAPR